LTFISLSAGIASEEIPVAVSGLYLAGNIGMVSGLSLASAVLQSTLQSGLETSLSGVDGKKKVSADVEMREYRANGIVLADNREGDFGHRIRQDADGARPGSGCCVLRAQSRIYTW
jgi:hypothetical protein